MLAVFLNLTDSDGHALQIAFSFIYVGFILVFSSQPVPLRVISPPGWLHHPLSKPETQQSPASLTLNLQILYKPF